MTDSMMGIKHPDYSATIDEVRKIRDCVDGQLAVKSRNGGLTYLPHPSDVDQTSDAAKARYLRFKAAAEFDGFTSKTLVGLNGAFNAVEPVFELPSQIEYLIDDSDGSGTSLKKAIESTADNILQVKFHCLLADFNGLVQDDNMTVTQAKALGLKASIKHYPRESLVDWDFSVVNGVYQMSYAKLSEKTTSVNKDTFEREEKTNHLILALDDDGFYYQQLITTDESGKDEISEKEYPLANGQRFDSLPFRIVTDDSSEINRVPKGFGILYPIALKALSRYRNSANLQEVLHRFAQPTVKSTGWSAGSGEIYNELNGSKQIKLGAEGGINLPDGVDISYLESNADNSYFFNFSDRNEKEVRALGGSFDTSDAKEEAVGVAKIKSAEQMAALVSTANSCEEAFTDMLEICYRFMTTGGEPEIKVMLNKEFNTSKLEPAERAAIINEYNMSVISLEEAQRQLKAGGVLQAEIEVIMQELEMGSGTISQFD